MKKKRRHRVRQIYGWKRKVERKMKPDDIPV